MMIEKIDELSLRLGHILSTQHLQLSTAESCTGGYLAQVITDIAGSSAWFDRGFVTYSNESKQEMLGVSETLIQQYGAVSLPVVRAMASGVLQNSHADVSVAISGIAGPSGGTPEKPVGTVCFAWHYPEQQLYAEQCLFVGDRKAVRYAAVQHALEKLLEFIGSN